MTEMGISIAGLFAAAVAVAVIVHHRHEQKRAKVMARLAEIANKRELENLEKIKPTPGNKERWGAFDAPVMEHKGAVIPDPIAPELPVPVEVVSDLPKQPKVVVFEEKGILSDPLAKEKLMKKAPRKAAKKGKKK